MNPPVSKFIIQLPVAHSYSKLTSPSCLFLPCTALQTFRSLCFREIAQMGFGIKRIMLVIKFGKRVMRIYKKQKKKKMAQQQQGMVYTQGSAPTTMPPGGAPAYAPPPPGYTQTPGYHPMPPSGSQGYAPMPQGYPAVAPGYPAPPSRYGSGVVMVPASKV